MRYNAEMIANLNPHVPLVADMVSRPMAKGRRDGPDTLVSLGPCQTLSPPELSESWLTFLPFTLQDTGFGGPIMVDRAVTEYARAGVAAFHIEVCIAIFNTDSRTLIADSGPIVPETLRSPGWQRCGQPGGVHSENQVR